MEATTKNWNIRKLKQTIENSRPRILDDRRRGKNSSNLYRQNKFINRNFFFSLCIPYSSSIFLILLRWEKIYHHPRHPQQLNYVIILLHFYHSPTMFELLFNSIIDNRLILSDEDIARLLHWESCFLSQYLAGYVDQRGEKKENI